MSIYRGFAFISNNGISLPIVNVDFGFLGRGYVGVFPVSLILMFLVFILFGVIMKYSAFGREVYSIGGNSKASHLAGINVRLIRLIVYIICGATAGLSGTILASQIGAGVANGGTGYELDVIAAVILGGTSLSGGKGTILGSLFGVLILVTMNNGMNLLGIQAFWQMVAKGVILMLAVILDVIRGGGYE
jgi:ribose/xylose/arabinose/galactoside ABC-type transport system permease subunit